MMVLNLFLVNHSLLEFNDFMPWYYVWLRSDSDCPAAGSLSPVPWCTTYCRLFSTCHCDVSPHFPPSVSCIFLHSLARHDKPRPLVCLFRILHAPPYFFASMCTRVRSHDCPVNQRNAATPASQRPVHWVPWPWGPFSLHAVLCMTLPLRMSLYRCFSALLPILPACRHHSDTVLTPSRHRDFGGEFR